MEKFSVIVFFVALAWAGFGCDERPHELWIDDACSPGDQAVIRSSVAEWNNLARSLLGESLVGIGGIDTVDHDKALTVGADPNWGRNFAVCFDQNPNVDRWRGLAGYAFPDGDVWLFRFGLSDRGFRITARHELGHFVGLDDLDAPRSVMDPLDTGEAFTDADRAELCRVYNCKRGR